MFDPFKAAAYSNGKVASLKDHQLYKSLHGYELRQCAKEAIESPIVGTAKDIGERFGHLHPDYYRWERVADHDADDRFVWAFMSSKRAYAKTRREDIIITPICKI